MYCLYFMIKEIEDMPLFIQTKTKLRKHLKKSSFVELAPIQSIPLDNYLFPGNVDLIDEDKTPPKDDLIGIDNIYTPVIEW